MKILETRPLDFCSAFIFTLTELESVDAAAWSWEGTAGEHRVSQKSRCPSLLGVRLCRPAEPVPGMWQRPWMGGGAELKWKQSLRGGDRTPAGLCLGPEPPQPPQQSGQSGGAWLMALGRSLTFPRGRRCSRPSQTRAEQNPLKERETLTCFNPTILPLRKHP